MIVGREVKDNKFWISHFDSSGKVRIEKISLPETEMYEWVYSNDPTDRKTWNGKYIKKYPVNKRSTIRWKFRIEELTQNLSPSTKDRVHEYNQPIVTYLDIENYVNEETNEFTDPSKAEFPINVMSLVTGDDITVLTTLKDMEESEVQRMEDETNEYFSRWNSTFKLTYIYFKTETDLLKYFSSRILPRLSCISGWNVLEYDWQYIHERCNQLGVNLLGSLESQSTSGKFHTPMHIGFVDYMKAVEKIKPYKDLENLKLNTVAERALNATKLENPYNSFADYMKDTFMFVKYNIIDSCLIKYIEQELLVLDSTFALCKISEVELCNVFSSVFVTETLLSRKFYERDNIVLPRVERSSSEDDGSYVGAFVMPPVPGYYENVVCFDFNSMYPNVAIEFNISPETYIGNGDDESIDVSSLPSYTKTAHNTLFSTEHRSVTGEVLMHYYDLRKSIQADLKKKKALLSEKKKQLEALERK